MGTRTWGGEVWLSSSNFLVDRGIATAAEFGVYGPEGTWLIEGHGVDPDIVVDNPPHGSVQRRGPPAQGGDRAPAGVDQGRPAGGDAGAGVSGQVVGGQQEEVT